MMRREEQSVIAGASVPLLSVDLTVGGIKSRPSSSFAADAVHNGSRARPDQALGSERRDHTIGIGGAQRVVNASRSHVSRGDCDVARELTLDTQIPLHDIVARRVEVDVRSPQAAPLLHQAQSAAWKGAGRKRGRTRCGLEWSR